MYENGFGVKQDATEAVEWFRKAAERGDAKAQCNLGRMYATGSGAEKNLAKSYQWLTLSGHGPLAQEPGFSREPWITILSSRPHFEIPVFMQSLDLFILPSKPVRESDHVWEEQFGHFWNG